MKIHFVKVFFVLATILSTPLLIIAGEINDYSHKEVEKSNITTIVESQETKSTLSKKEIDETQINGSTKICELKDNKKAAYSFTTDDGDYNAIQYYNEDFKRLNLRGSMALIASRIVGQEDNFRFVISEGHFDVTNHSMTHINLATVKDKVTMEREINESQSLLKTKFLGQDVITMANPYVTNSNLADSVIKQNHYAARNGRTGYNSLNPTENEWYHLNLIPTYNYNASQPYSSNYLNASLNTAIKNGNWLIILAHGLGTDRNSIPKIDITAHFEYVASKLEEVWCATFNEVTKYIYEKQHAKINVNQSTSSKIVITLTHNLNKQIFNFPLTLKTIVPKDWIETTVEQNGVRKNINTHIENGVHFVYYDAIPNFGNIKITKQ